MSLVAALLGTLAATSFTTKATTRAAIKRHPSLQQHRRVAGYAGATRAVAGGRQSVGLIVLLVVVLVLQCCDSACAGVSCACCFPASAHLQRPTGPWRATRASFEVYSIDDHV
jgi:hypothetical protein